MVDTARTPTVEDCAEKIAAALKALERDDGWDPVDHFRLIRKLDALGLAGRNQTIILRRALSEVRPRDYAGWRPPQTSYEAICYGLPMFAFAWDSTLLVPDVRLYIKFCIAEEDGHLILVNLHKDGDDDEVR